MVDITKEVCSEVYDIIQHMKKELVNKIPNSFINLIKQNRDENFIVNIDYSKRINDQELQRGTRVILSLIYRDYLCSKEQREELIKKDKEELKIIEEQLRKKYNLDNLFKNNKNKLEKIEEKETTMVIYEETIIQKFLNKLKEILHLN